MSSVGVFAFVVKLFVEVSVSLPRCGLDIFRLMSMWLFSTFSRRHGTQYSCTQGIHVI